MTQTPEQAPLRIGLTGGIASGKSLVADMFAELSIPVIDTDVIAREVVAPGQPALDEIEARFGEHVFDAAGHIDRAAMRETIFLDDGERHALEKIVHPRIGAETRRQADLAGGEYQIIVVPLLASSPLADFVDRILVVDCDEETQVDRLLARDAGSEKQARRIIAAQASRDQRLAIADDVILNEGEIDDARSAVTRLDQKYRRFAARRGPHEQST